MSARAVDEDLVVADRRGVRVVAAGVRPLLPLGDESPLDGDRVALGGVLVDVGVEQAVEVGVLLADADELLVVGEHPDAPRGSVARDRSRRWSPSSPSGSVGG